MKNLKKALSMVLASAMLFGMMVVGTGAAHADVTAEHNEEAIAVVSAAGIMGANEEFNPDAKITRNEMAVVMVNMLGLDTDDFAGASNFTDVPAWAADYVDACYANGIVSGVSATEFNGGANVTTAEAALMVMKALGYFQYASDFGADWMLATIKQASKIDLLADIDAKATAALTRNEVAQLVLNALEATMVEADEDGIGLDAEGNLVSKYEYIKVYSNEAYATVIGAENTLELGEELFEGDLVFEAGVSTDSFGRPAVEWTFDGETVGTFVTKTPAFTFTTAMKEKELFKAIGAAGKQGEYDKYIEMKAIYVNGENMTNTLTGTKVIAKNDSSNIAGFGNGVTVEIFKTSKANEYTMVAYNEYISTVKSIIKADADKGIDRQIVITGAGAFETESFEKGDVVLYTMDKNGVASVKAPATISGKVTKISNGTKYTIDGEVYTLSQNAQTSLSMGDKGTWYVDSCGNIIDVKTAEDADVYYGYLLAYGKKSAADADLFGENADVNGEKVKFVDAKGEKVTLDTAYTVDKDNVATYVAPAGWNNTTKHVLFAYELNSKGEISKITPVSAVSSANMTVTKGNANMTDSSIALTADTVFFYVDLTSGSEKYAVYTGYKTAPTKTGTLIGYVADAGKMEALVLSVADVEAESDKQYVYFAGTDVDVESTEDGDIYTYTNVYVNGEKTTLKAETNALSFTAGYIYEYTTDGDGYTTLGNAVVDTEAAGTEIDLVQETYFKKGGANVYVDDKTVYYEVDQANNTIAVVEGLPALSDKDAYDVMWLYNDKGTNKDSAADLVVFFVK